MSLPENWIKSGERLLTIDQWIARTQNWRHQWVFIIKLQQKSIITVLYSLISLASHCVTRAQPWSHLGSESHCLTCRFLLISDSEPVSRDPRWRELHTCQGLGRYPSALHRDSTVCSSSNSTGTTWDWKNRSDTGECGLRYAVQDACRHTAGLGWIHIPQKHDI